MIASNANQYIRPEYLTPLPTTLDAKKSPLALLAQTCSQIGADTPGGKSLLPPLDKNKKSESRDKISPSSSVSSCSPNTTKSSFKPYELQPYKEQPQQQEERVASRVRTPLKTPTPAQNGSRCPSNHSAGSPRASPGSRKTPTASNQDANQSKGTIVVENGPSSSSSSSPSKAEVSKLPTVTTSAPSYLSGYPGPSPLDVMASSLLSHPLKSAASINPYLNYSRLKAAAGGGEGGLVCRDPYCTGCQLNSHLLAKGGGGPCPAGCTQCDSKSGFLPHSSAVAAAYAHAQLAALAAASQLPYVCSWIAGDAAYCGKRFSTSDELLQHLRTHTSDSLLTSPSAGVLHRTYPTPPLSPLSSPRYHPYGKPPLLPPSLSSAFPLHPHPGLPPYFSPYSLYGPRLGASPGMHP